MNINNYMFIKKLSFSQGQHEDHASDSERGKCATDFPVVEFRNPFQYCCLNCLAHLLNAPLSDLKQQFQMHQ